MPRQSEGSGGDVDVTEDLTFEKDLDIDGTLTVNGSGNFRNGLATYGTSNAVFGTHIVGNKSLDLNSADSNLNVNSKFTVAGSTGNTFVGGELSVNGTTTLNGSVNVGNGPVVFGQYDNNNGEKVLFRDGLTSYGNITVSGNTQLQNNLFVNHDATLGNDSNDIVTIKGPATLENNLTVNGNTTLGNSTSDTITFAGIPKLPVFTTLPNTGTLGQMIIYQSPSGAQYLKVWIRTTVGLGSSIGSAESWMSVILM
jgi:hypothetical protein